MRRFPIRRPWRKSISRNETKRSTHRLPTRWSIWISTPTAPTDARTSSNTSAGTDKDGEQMELNIRVTEIYQRINGKWQIIHEHASVPVDIKTGKADLFSLK
ncbi:MAG TPA: nuclear transport factor 2 family protein [Candidatus Binataceae bacterium]|nr:nuclear transport factor 2 family protein [Candidatus Binataceae bacterium]